MYFTTYTNGIMQMYPSVYVSTLCHPAFFSVTF